MTADGDASADPADYEALEGADVTVWTTEEGLHVAEDGTTGVSSQGRTEADAVRNLAAALDSHAEARADDTGDDWL